MLTAAEIIVSGAVQGVGYRYFAIRQAEQYSLTGYVRNLADGRVAVYAEGEKELIDHFKMALEEGPRFAHVEKVEIIFSSYKAKYKNFSVEY
jgi:acylphosphatase